MSNGQWTFGGGPAERIEDQDGQFRAGVPLYVRSAVTYALADVTIVTGANGLIPMFWLPREWQWSSVLVSVDEIHEYPLGQARELQARPSTVLRLQDIIQRQQTLISQQRQMVAMQGEQIGALLSQVAASSTNDLLPGAVDPSSPDLPDAVDPDTGEEGGELPLPDEPDTPGNDMTALPLPEGFTS